MSDLEKYAQNTQVDVAQSAPLSQGALAMLNLEQQAHAMQNALSIAQAMCATQMVPKSYFRKPEDGAAAIMYGAELGLNAMQSLQQIMVINGKPGIETRTAVALLKVTVMTFARCLRVTNQSQWRVRDHSGSMRNPRGILPELRRQATPRTSYTRRSHSRCCTRRPRWKLPVKSPRMSYPVSPTPRMSYASRSSL